MCIEGLNRCFRRPAMDPDNHRTSHDDAGSKQKPPKSSDGGKYGWPNRPTYENGAYSNPNQPKDVPTRDSTKTVNRASDDGLPSNFKGQPYHPKDSNGRAAVEGPDKASQVSAFPKNSGVNTYAYPQETTSKEVPPTSAVKPNNSPIDGSLHGSQPYPEETKLSAKAGDDRVGNTVFASTGDFKAKEQTKAIDSRRE